MDAIEQFFATCDELVKTGQASHVVIGSNDLIDGTTLDFQHITLCKKDASVVKLDAEDLPFEQRRKVLERLCEVLTPAVTTH